MLSNSTMCPRNGQRMAKTAMEFAPFVLANPKTKNGPSLGLHGSNQNSEGI